MTWKKPSQRRSPAEHADLARRVLRFLARHEIARAGEHVGVAVSGGADSVALMHLFLELRRKRGFLLSILHFNHKLRGRASDADEKFVAKLAAHHGLEFLVAHEDIGKKAKRERSNLEDAARRARYNFFERCVHEGHVTRIAVAHTADDQAETVLAHILRGTGLAGLGGIHPQAGAVFRPQLGIRRAELRVYLRAKEQIWREDATNRDIRRMRARIRQKLLPLLEKDFHPGVVEHLCQLAELAREDEAFLKDQTSQWARGPAQQLKEETRIQLSEFLRGPRALKTRFVRQVVHGLKPHGGQLSLVHVEAVLEMAEQHDSGKTLHLPGGVEVRRDRDALRFRVADACPARVKGKSARREYAYDVDLRPGEAQFSLVELPCTLHLRVIDWPAEGRETKQAGAVLDHGRLGVPLVLRNWRSGDTMQPFGHQRPHKLARLLNELGVSRWEKEIWPVLTSGGKLAWARGLAVAAEFAATKETRAGILITEEPVS
jgi:tRNA(Ile)-lysidine synthase